MVGALETAQILLFVIIIKNNKQKSKAEILEKYICQNDGRHSDWGLSLFYHINYIIIT